LLYLKEILEKSESKKIKCEKTQNILRKRMAKYKRNLEKNLELTGC